MRQGLDTWFGLPYSHDMRMTVPRDKGLQTAAYYGPKTEYWDVPLLRNGETIERPVDHRTLTRRYTEGAVRFVANRGGAFFLYLAHSLPHIPLARSEAFAGRSGGGMYGDVVEELDWSVGRVRDVAAAHPDVVADLVAAAAAHRRTVVPTRPLFDALLPSRPGGR